MTDYCPNGVPSMLVMGLAWDVTNGVNIDLDASAILLDAKLQQIDLVFFGKLGSSDGSIKHGGDEREGDEKGDDEKIFLQLGRVHPAVKYIGFVINSYSGAHAHALTLGTPTSLASCPLAVFGSQPLTRQQRTCPVWQVRSSTTSRTRRATSSTAARTATSARTR